MIPLPIFATMLVVTTLVIIYEFYKYRNQHDLVNNDHNYSPPRSLNESRRGSTNDLEMGLNIHSTPQDIGSSSDNSHSETSRNSIRKRQGLHYDKCSKLLEKSDLFVQTANQLRCRTIDG